MCQGELDIVKQEKARLNMAILGISEQKWVGMAEFNSGDYYIYYYGLEFLRKNGVTLIVKNKKSLICSSVQFSSVAQWYLTLCNPMNCSTPALPVHYQLLESTQTHVHRVRDAIQSSYPLSSPSPPAHNPSQHQGLFQ